MNCTMSSFENLVSERVNFDLDIWVLTHFNSVKRIAYFARMGAKLKKI